jgi:hypothetical protein
MLKNLIAIARLKFSIRTPNTKVKRSKILVPMERSCRMKYGKVLSWGILM